MSVDQEAESEEGGEERRNSPGYLLLTIPPTHGRSLSNPARLCPAHSARRTVCMHGQLRIWRQGTADVRREAQAGIMTRRKSSTYSVLSTQPLACMDADTDLDLAIIQLDDCSFTRRLIQHATSFLLSPSSGTREGKVRTSPCDAWRI